MKTCFSSELERALVRGDVIERAQYSFYFVLYKMLKCYGLKRSVITTMLHGTVDSSQKHVVIERKTDCIVHISFHLSYISSKKSCELR